MYVSPYMKKSPPRYGTKVEIFNHGNKNEFFS